MRAMSIHRHFVTSNSYHQEDSQHFSIRSPTLFKKKPGQKKYRTYLGFIGPTGHFLNAVIRCPPLPFIMLSIHRINNMHDTMPILINSSVLYIPCHSPLLVLNPFVSDVEAF